MCIDNPVKRKNIPRRVAVTCRGTTVVADVERPHPNPMGSPTTVFDLKLPKRRRRC